MCLGPLCFLNPSHHQLKIKISWGRNPYLETMDAQSFMPMITGPIELMKTFIANTPIYGMNIGIPDK